MASTTPGSAWADLEFGDARNCVDASRRRYLAGDPAGAAALVPHDLIDSTTLLGTRDRIADRLKAYAATGVTTLIAMPGGTAPGGTGPGLEERLAMLRTLMEAAELAGVLDSDVPSS